MPAGEDTLPPEDRLALAVSCHEQGDVAGAIEHYRLYVDAVPDHADALHLLCAACYQSGDSQDAVDYIEAAIRLDTGRHEFHSNYGLALGGTGRYDEAITAFERALELRPDFADALTNLGNTYVVTDRFDEAEATFRRLLELDPDNPHCCNNLAVLLSRETESDESVELFRRALRLQPDYVDAHLNFGRLLVRLHRFDESVEHLEAAVAAQADNVPALCLLADAQRRSGRLQDALATAQRALVLAPDDGQAIVAAGNAHHALDEMDVALEHYRQALVVDPGNPRATNNIGSIMASRGDYESAVKYFAAALRTDPDFAEAHFNQGVALQKLGRTGEAADSLISSLARDQHNPQAYRYLAEIYRVTEMPEAQLEVLRQWARHDPRSPTANYLLRAAGDESKPDRAPDDFIREEFDNFADEFDTTLAGLEYKTPELIGDLLARQFAGSDERAVILDAGCGTGLCAGFLKPLSSKLMGVDLSSQMIAKARKLGLYDELIVCELVEFMRERRADYDLIVSADTLVYFGALKDVFEAANNALRDNGQLVFSVEALSRDESGYRLGPSGRYAHSAAYIEESLSAAGFSDVVSAACALRLEAGKPVDGLIVSARKSGQVSP